MHAIAYNHDIIRKKDILQSFLVMYLHPHVIHAQFVLCIHLPKYLMHLHCALSIAGIRLILISRAAYFFVGDLKAKIFTMGEWYRCRGLALANSGISTLGFNHGLRQGHSCELQLLGVVNDFLKPFNCGLQTGADILNFSKAFDTVPPTKTHVQT